MDDGYKELQAKISKVLTDDSTFEEQASYIKNYVDDLTQTGLVDVISNIGVIPESVGHDSTEEKFYAKVSDIVLSRCFSELGLKTRVLTERADAADVYAESFYHGYSLVGDAKIFRLSRTAKNQKDFKVAGLNSWRRDANYAVLCSPWYQYPTRISQVYKEALDLNVSLFSWEYLIYLVKNGIKETQTVNLSDVWNFSETLSHKVSTADSKNRFIERQDKFISSLKGNGTTTMSGVFDYQEHSMDDRADVEKSYWKSVINDIKNYSREKAIEELLKEKKIDKKISQIDKTLKGLKKTFDSAKE